MTTVTARAPGRVTIVGEHTDYNGGLALTTTIDRAVTVSAVPATGRAVEVRSVVHGADDHIELDAVEAVGGWRAYVRGTVNALRGAGVPIGACSVTIESDLPMDAGLASSAALELAVATALLRLHDAPQPDSVTLARLCSGVEHTWAGADTGLLDQLAILGGAATRACLIDFQSLTTQHVPLELCGWTLATIDSRQRRELAMSGYNARREECAAACRALRLPALRDATLDDARRLRAPLDARVRHVVSENGRVTEAVAALRAHDMAALADAVNGSHASLRDRYEVSTPQVEAVVARVLDAGAAGARLIGGGFGGHVLALFPPGVTPPGDARVVRPGAGVEVTAS